MQTSFLEYNIRGSPLYRWIGLAYIVGFLAFLTGDHFLYWPKAAAIRGELEREFALIKPPPDARYAQYLASNKTHQALVDASYTTRLSYPELRVYYDAELAKHGWRFYNEEGVRELSIDYGGKDASYCKGDYAVSLFYPGGNRYPYTYALSVSWGLDHMDHKLCSPAKASNK